MPGHKIEIYTNTSVKGDSPTRELGDTFDLIYKCMNVERWSTPAVANLGAAHASPHDLSDSGSRARLNEACRGARSRADGASIATS